MNFEKLKETARKYEQKEEWRRAIEVYLQAIREFEAGNDPVPDLSVYNRIGDLYLKATEPALAVQAYERAADLYGEQGFYNNAIALCGKILRVNPGRIQTYLKLAHLHARKNVVIEAKKNLLEYLERMNAMNQLDDAFKALKDFADQFPGNKDIRLMLSELLRASSRNAEAKEQLEKLANDLEARGDTVGARKTLMRLQALESSDPNGGAPAGADAGRPAAPAAPPRRGGNDLVFLDTGADLPRMPAPKSATPPITRKTRAVTTPAEPAAPAASSIPLIDVSHEPKQPAAEATPASLVDDSPLQIETSSLVDTPLELETMKPLSDEALVELSGASDVPQALGFEPTELGAGDAADVAPLEGLELDAPASDEVELHVSTEGLDLERASLDPDELEPGQRTSLIVPPAVDEPEMGTLDLEPTLAAEETTGDIDLIDTGTPGEVEELPAEPEFVSLQTDAADELTLIDPPADEAVAADMLAVEPEAPEEEAVEFVSLDEEEGVAVIPDDELPSADEMPRFSAPDVSIEEPLPTDGPSISDLEDRVLEDPDDPEAHRALGEALLAEGDQFRGQEELELALAGYETREDWQHAGDLINELIRLDPNGVRYHQKRVEIGFRSGDRSRLIDSYLELADALLRVGAMDKALAVYRRVAEHDPGNQRAHAALDALAVPEDDMPMIPLPPAAEAPKPAPIDDRSRHKSAPVTKVRDEPADGDFIDLGALVMDDEGVKDTRMRVDDEEPTGDEQKDFQDMLSAFKRGIDENIAAEDYQSHYDLGVAFKEMGLLDEAIAEFQKALRAPEGRLKTSEALGTSFYEKGQFAIAEAILKRAVESLGATDDEQIGLIYWLGRSQEEQNKVDQAIASFERVLAVDIGFGDVSARIGRLAAGRGK